jgi:hypothetical protein
MFWWTEASISCSNLSAAATCKHADSASYSTHRQLMGGDEEPGEPDKNSPDTPGPTMLKDPGAGAALPEMLAPAPRTTKSCSSFSALSLGQGRHLPPSTTVPTPPLAANR